MTGTAVLVEVAVVPGEQPLQRRHQVALRAAPRLHQGEAGRGMQGEQADKAIAAVLDECADVVGDVDDLRAAGVDRQLSGSQRVVLRAGWDGTRPTDCRRWALSTCA